LRKLMMEWNRLIRGAEQSRKKALSESELGACRVSDDEDEAHMIRSAKRTSEISYLSFAVNTISFPALTGMIVRGAAPPM